MSTPNVLIESSSNFAIRSMAAASQKNSVFDIFVLNLVPVLCVIALINNTAILAITFSNTPFRKDIFASIRLQYAALAVADICIVFIFHIPEWFGVPLMNVREEQIINLLIIVRNEHYKQYN